MAKNKVVEGVIEAPVVEVSKSNGGMLTKLVVGGLGIAAAVGTALFVKNKRNRVAGEATETETDQNDNEK